MGHARNRTQPLGDGVVKSADAVHTAVAVTLAPHPPLDQELVLSSGSSLHVRVARNEDPWAPCFELSIGEYSVYNEELYAGFDADEERTERYRNALAAEVKGKVVVDIGAGANLFWALECLKLGARKVYAIEEIPASCELARQLIERQALQGRLELVSGNSLRVRLPERAEVCVSEIIGFIGGAEGAEAVLADARVRHLKPDACLVPERCITRMSGVRLPEPLHRAPALHPGAVPYLKAVFDDVGHPFDIRMAARHFPPNARVTTEGVFEDLTFRNDTVERTVKSELCVLHSGRLDGLLLWIELFCGAGQPPIDSLFDSVSWTPVFLPVTYPGIEVVSGEILKVTVESEISEDGAHPDYHVTITSSGNVKYEYSSFHHRAHFRKSTFTQALFPSSGLKF